ncbi:CPBP family intramembrane metalloprotease domain-containing protein [Bordetella genomosp. 1]|uniref:CPBP family intramembrane metalloprotease domain-containing protein n=2 Tax=Bordetella genomosp. 1 TaxID=1395607 RepID=A0A261SFI3_9BORD|nr:CPBP family intramembrane metalloprotease domain-containing protein [Bordetella genomosp. 1]
MGSHTLRVRFVEPCPMTPGLAPWFLLTPAYVLLWPRATRPAALALAVAGLGFAAYDGQVDARALLALALLGLSAWAVRLRRGWPVPLGHALFIATAIALALHLLPGFHNPRVIDAVQFDPRALPFTMYLNYDKPIIALWIMLVLAPPRFGPDARATVGAALAAGTAACVLCLGTAWALEFTRWAPHWPAEGGLWLLNNAVFVTLAEEALFRGYVQERLTRRIGPWPACAIAALLFGLAHFDGGPALIALATLAGLCYGWAYRHGGLAAAVLAHLALNAAHFGLFVYPALAG